MRRSDPAVPIGCVALARVKTISVKEIGASQTDREAELNAQPNVTPYKQHRRAKPAQIRIDLERLGRVRISRARDRAILHCCSMPAARMTLPHFALCSGMKAANSAGVFHFATLPRALERPAGSGRFKVAAQD